MGKFIKIGGLPVYKNLDIQSVLMLVDFSDLQLRLGLVDIDKD